MLIVRLGSRLVIYFVFFFLLMQCHIYLVSSVLSQKTECDVKT